MARIERVAVEIMTCCDELGHDINYYKVQSLAYICQCVYYLIHKNSLSPEKFYFWPTSNGTKEIYNFFNSSKLLECSFKNIDNFYIKFLAMQRNEEIDFLLSFEKEVIDFVLSKYGQMTTEYLINLTRGDFWFDNYMFGEEIKIEQLSNYFVVENEFWRIRDDLHYKSKVRNIQKRLKNKIGL